MGAFSMKEESIGFALIENLKNQLQAYKELTDLAEEKSNILVKGNIELLEDITEVEQMLILKLGKLEKERFALMNQIAEKTGKNVSEIKNNILRDFLSSEEIGAFSAVSDELKTVLLYLSEKNETNEKLIRNTLDYIDFSIKLLTDAGEVPTNYSSEGTNNKEAFHFIDK